MINEGKEIEELSSQIDVLSRKREALRNKVRAEKAAKVIEDLKNQDFYFRSDIGSHAELIVDYSNDFMSLCASVSDGWNHFQVPIAEKIIIRVDDSSMGIQYDPSLEEHEGLKNVDELREIGIARLKLIVKFLKDHGVPFSKISAHTLIKEVKNSENRLQKAKNNLSSIENIISEIYN